MNASRKKFGEILIEASIITPTQFVDILEKQKTRKIRLGQLVIEEGIATEEDIARALSNQVGFPFVEMKEMKIDPAALAIIDEDLAKRHMIIPCALSEDTLYIAMADPLSFSAIDDAAFRSGLKVSPVVATPSDIISSIERHYNIMDSLAGVVESLGVDENLEIMSATRPISDVTELKKKGEAPPIIRTVNAIMTNAIRNRASDIHIEPTKKNLIIRDRVDGLLKKMLELPKWVQASVISRIKIMAELDIAEKRVPQDGRIRLRYSSEEIDLRVSTLPTRFGEKAVIRLLNNPESFKSMNSISLSKSDYKRIKEVVEMPQGVILVTGPTGSGKSTSLYAFLDHVRNEKINIVTLEDPIEYEMSGITQVQINDKAGLTFSKGLRSILRQDPDVIMVGELRDNETAEIAMKAAMTGHLVMCTLHTNDAVSSLSRLTDMGIPSYMVSSSLTAIVSQRLVRAICLECKESYPASEDELKKMEIDTENKTKIHLYRGKGCDYCKGSGYFDRIGIYEILIMNRVLKELVDADRDTELIEASARASGMKLIWEDAKGKALAGLTTLEEIQRVVQRRDVVSNVCVSCGKINKEDYNACPYCGYERSVRCKKCNRLMGKEWNYCPYCFVSLKFSGMPEYHSGEDNNKMNIDANGNPADKHPVLLIVEEGQNLRRRLKHLLERRTLCSFASVDDADIIASSVVADDPRLIIIDSNLPGAVEALQDIKEINEHVATIPVLAILNEQDSMDKREFVKQYADETIEKPFPDEVIIKSIERLWWMAGLEESVCCT